MNLIEDKRIKSKQYLGLYSRSNLSGSADMQTLEGEGSQDEEDAEEFDSELLVRETFKTLFPDSFDGVLPIRKHKVLLLCLLFPTIGVGPLLDAGKNLIRIASCIRYRRSNACNFGWTVHYWQVQFHSIVLCRRWTCFWQSGILHGTSWELQRRSTKSLGKLRDQRASPCAADAKVMCKSNPFISATDTKTTPKTL